MKMGASKPILGDRQTIQNIEFFNSISAVCEFRHGAANGCDVPIRSLVTSAAKVPEEPTMTECCTSNRGPKTVPKLPSTKKCYCDR